MTEVDQYRLAGVNIDAGNEAARRYGALAKRTLRSGVIGNLGGFAGGFAIDVSRYPEPILCSGTDGVGTKLKIAFAEDRHDTIGIDCVAMCVNDILVMGAEPLYFLDYLAVGQLDVAKAESIVAGVAEGCAQAGAALIGGETAEMPGMYADGEYDLAGFAVGVVNRDKVIDGTRIEQGDVVIGLASSGVHSNGYSLVRKLLSEAGVSFSDRLPGWRGTVGEELLRPTSIYVKPILALLEEGVPIRGMAHITGGGLLENIPRCLPSHVNASLRIGSWPVPAVFDWLMKQAGMTFFDASRIWNLGIGYVLIVPQADADDTLRELAKLGQTAFRIGEIVAGDKQVVWEGLQA